MSKAELYEALKRATNYQDELTDEEIETLKDYDQKALVAERLAEELWKLTELD